VTPLKIKRQELVHRQKRNVCTKSFYDNNSITISFSRNGIKKWFCEFIVHTQCDMVVERIKPDIPSMTEMLEKRSIFFKDFAKLFFNSI
jgi:hypothetical protein